MATRMGARSDGSEPVKTASEPKMPPMTISTSASAKGCGSVMGERIAHRTAPIHYQTARSVAHRESVDEALARLHGGTPGSWHQKRFGRAPVNIDTARIAAELRRRGDLEGYGRWMLAIEDVTERGACPDVNPHLTSAIEDAVEDVAEAQFNARPCEETARALIRKRAADRQASLNDDREIAARFAIQL